MKRLEQFHNRLLRAVVEPPSLELFKKSVDVILRNVGYWATLVVGGCLD